METLDSLCTSVTQLSNEELDIFLSALMREKKDRDCKAQKAAWAKVREAINNYVANFGNIRVADFCGYENVEIILQHGQFAFSEYGDIEVGA
jgi:hypothetical protein